MDEIKSQRDNQVTLKDLKLLGLHGNVTAYLTTGETVYLKAKYGLIKRRAIVAGEEKEVCVKVRYSMIYKQIKTIKRNHLLIACQKRVGKTKALLLTGKGYHRPHEQRKIKKEKTYGLS